MRDTQFTRKKPEGSFRILALGDSFTFGPGIPFEDTFPRQVEVRLNAEWEKSRFKVINAGRQGADTAWELDFLNSKGWGFEPDLIVLQFYLNDIKQRVKSDPASTLNRLKSALKRPFYRSYVLFFLRDRFDALESAVRVRADKNAPPDYFWAQAEVIAQNGPAWRDFGSAIEGFGAVSRERGIPIITVLFPHPGEPHDALPLIHDAVAARCRAEGLYVIDLLEHIARIDSRKQVVSEVDHHPSALFHALAAERLVEGLRVWGILPE